MDTESAPKIGIDSLYKLIFVKKHMILCCLSFDGTNINTIRFNSEFTVVALQTSMPSLSVVVRVECNTNFTPGCHVECCTHYRLMDDRDD